MSAAGESGPPATAAASATAPATERPLATEQAPAPATEQPPAPADTQQGHDDSLLQLEPDTATPSDSDADSAYEGGSTASTSLASSVVNYEYQNGRRYHGYRSGAYVLPNDDEEQDRLDFVHHIFLLILDGKLYDAPLPSPPQRVLDLGTGTGIWAIDYGDENPGAEVLGTDLSPIQPSWVPPNVKFYIDDAESEWVYPPEERFDFIHVRELSGGISDWDKLCRQAYANLQPNGWLEFQEPIAWFGCDDDSFEHAKDVGQWQELCNDAAKNFGKIIMVADTLKEKMQNAGFVDVHEKIVKVPIGPWPKDPKQKEIGRYHREQIIQGIAPYTLGFLGKVAGWSEQECQVIIAKVISQLRSPKLHVYVRYYFVYGRRAETAAY